jgi:ABC-type polysaccharide/polyol phosphate export permease
MISGWAMLVAMFELLLFGVGVTVIFYTLNRFFKPFKKLVDILVNADKY